MSWIDQIVERQIAAAIERGEMDGGPLQGKPLPDADVARPPGWWAEQLVQRERSRVAREDRSVEHAAWKRRFWQAPSAAALDPLVADANRWIVAANADLVADDRFELFSLAEVTDEWRTARVPPRPGRASSDNRWRR